MENNCGKVEDWIILRSHIRASDRANNQVHNRAMYLNCSIYRAVGLGSCDVESPKPTDFLPI
ncbi:hypothetical protein [Pseudanabaena sp. UWO310]|uniref:hypothetical protein n=1 Tax=Pseudanabaena sp. UWO310 TaxID=2480795 RepID=UPI001156ED2A|nr:hypothetical protein [Pseudanabaena sp. UWO310]TYQ30639.1 hypothetical protein PseudUWO310_07640 [Pseudanabaena sp. UWO310]